MNICKNVALRARELKNGMLSLYLDYYPAYRNPDTRQVWKHESLGIYIYAKPRNARERKFNDEMMEKAENPEDYYINVIMQDKIRLYLEYVENASFLYDLKLIFKTFRVIVTER